MFWRKTQKNTCASLFFNEVAGIRQACNLIKKEALAEVFSCNFIKKEALAQVFSWNFIKKEALAQVFSCEFCEISKNTFSYRTPLVTASGCSLCSYRSKKGIYLEC